MRRIHRGRIAEPRKGHEIGEPAQGIGERVENFTQFGFLVEAARRMAVQEIRNLDEDENETDPDEQVWRPMSCKFYKKEENRREDEPCRRQDHGQGHARIIVLQGVRQRRKLSSGRALPGRPPLTGVDVDHRFADDAGREIAHEKHRAFTVRSFSLPRARVLVAMTLAFGMGWPRWHFSWASPWRLPRLPDSDAPSPTGRFPHRGNGAAPAPA